MNFSKKTIVAIIFALVTITIVFFLRQINIIWFDLLVLFFIFTSVNEMDNALKKAGYTTITPMIYIATIAAYPMFMINGLGLKGVVITIIISFIIGSCIMTFKQDKYNYKDLLASSFILIYPLLMMMLFVDINHNIGGLFGITAILLIAILSDTFAQWTGMLIKGKKLCPRISPKKTVAGFCGAYLGGIIAALIIFVLVDVLNLFVNTPNVNLSGLTSNIWYSLPIYVLLAILGSTASQLGDLVASWLKRQFGIKDFGTFLPGHGGLMDRADSIMFTGPVFYIIFLFIPNLVQ